MLSANWTPCANYYQNAQISLHNKFARARYNLRKGTRSQIIPLRKPLISINGANIIIISTICSITLIKIMWSQKGHVCPSFFPDDPLFPPYCWTRCEVWTPQLEISGCKVRKTTQFNVYTLRNARDMYAGWRLRAQACMRIHFARARHRHIEFMKNMGPWSWTGGK